MYAPDKCDHITYFSSLVLKPQSLSKLSPNFHTVLSPMSNLSFLGLVFAVFGKEVGKDVATATGDVDQRTFLPETKT